MTRMITMLAPGLLAVAWFVSSAHTDALERLDAESLRHQDLLAQIEPFRQRVDEPDVMGGYASDTVIVRAVPGVAVAHLDDGRPVLLRRHDNVPHGDAAMEIDELALAAKFKAWDVTAIAPTLPFEPANAALATALGLDRYYSISVPAGSDTRAFAERLAMFGQLIEHAEVDGIGGILQTVPNDPSFNVQYGLQNTGQVIAGQPGTPGADINATAAWTLETGSEDVIIAIIDTGLTSSHPDLAPNAIPGFNINGNNSDTSDSWLIPHGTHCAGIAAARGDNGIGITGVSWHSKIMPVKVLNFLGGGTETQCANGIIWAVDNGAHIGSLSLGFPDGISYFENAVNYAHAEGMLLVAASGNTPGGLIPFPARWDNVMAVGATNNLDTLASFTTTGPQMSVTAPGWEVYSTYGGLFGGAYAYQSGTSMATPHVAGLAALVMSANRALTNDDVRNIIESTADDLGSPGWNPQFGHGRIDAFAAVSLALELAEECPVPADLNCDGEVNGIDLLILLGAWGPCPDANACPADLNGDGFVDVFDLLILLEQWQS